MPTRPVPRDSSRQYIGEAPAHEEIDRATKGVEAEAVAYVVGRHFGVDVSDSRFYLAGWSGEATEIEHYYRRL